MEQKFASPKKPVLTGDGNFGSDMDSLFEGDEDIDRASRSLKAISHPCG
jgi:hypothetical protein